MGLRAGIGSALGPGTPPHRTAPISPLFQVSCCELCRPAEMPAARCPWASLQGALLEVLHGGHILQPPAARLPGRGLHLGGYLHAAHVQAGLARHAPLCSGDPRAGRLHAPV